MDIYELVSLTILELVPITASWLISILLVQVSSFYLILLGYIYANEEGREGAKKICLVSLGIFPVIVISSQALNMLAFVMRLSINFLLDGFLPRNIHNL